ncbi:MAG: cytochrome P450 [Actinobacteria bacterium]|nr:cytochrome P450 [Actinomycetota bacterium]
MPAPDGSPPSCPGRATAPRSAVEFDHHDPRLGAEEVWAAYARLSAECPVAWSEAHGGFWVVTGFEEARAAARDHGRFSSAEGHLIPMRGPGRSIPIDFDPPLHAAYREPMMAVLDRGRVRELEGPIRELVGERLGAMVARGRGEVVAELALPLPLLVLSELLGLSEATLAALRPVTERMWERVETEDLAAARTEIVALLDTEIDRQLDSGATGAIATLAGAEVEGRPLRRDELQRMLTTFVVAGHETTMHAIGNLFFDLASNPEVQAAVRADPGLGPAIVEESLRLRAPSHGFARTLTGDADLGGTRLRAGDQALLVFAAANRDPRRYPSPASFLPGRPERGHLAFGAGIHHCAGAFLARLELRTITDLLAALPAFHLDGEPVFSGLEGGHHMGPRSLPIAFAG